MDYSQLITLSKNYHQHELGGIENFEFTAMPKRKMSDKNNNTVYEVGISAIVNIDKFKDGGGFQIYRATGHHVRGNSHKAYKSLDLLFEDFEIQKA